MISNYINIYNLLFFIFGIGIDCLNNVFLKKTVNSFLVKKDRSILFLSFLIRMLVFLIIFIIICLCNVKKLYFVFFGLIFSKILLLIKNYVDKQK